MRLDLLELICCPLCKNDFDVIPLRQEEDSREEAVLVCRACKGIYPVIGGVPRLLPNASLQFHRFLAQHREKIAAEVWRANFESVNKEHLAGLIKAQRRTQKSFSLEWSVQGEEDVTWQWGTQERTARVLDVEMRMPAQERQNKVILDAGCGNGLLTSELGKHFASVLGLDLSFSVEAAHRKNRRANVHFIQGDLMHPPLKLGAIDAIYSNGVLHHTPNTELAFSCLVPVLKPQGRFCMWLYKPEPDLHHQTMLALRRIFRRLPLKLSAALFFLFFVPLSLLKRKIKNIFLKKYEPEVGWRVQLINLIDGLTPKYRFEHTPEEVKIWYHKRGFSNVQVTLQEYLGFVILGDRASS
ncbi:MAG: methyltransferase domain-containing protein [candidate division KSB1 bacterium]